MQSYYSMSTLHRHPQTPTLPNNGYNQPNPNPNPNPAYYASLPRHLSHPHLNRIPDSVGAGGPSGQGQTPVIFNVFAQNGDLQAVHYGTLPLRPSGNGAGANLKRSGSTKSIGATSNTSTLKKSTPGANQILKWIQNQKAKFKSSKSSRSSVVSANSGTLKPPPKNGILRDSGRRSAQPPPVTMPRHDYSQYVGSLPRDWHSYRQHSAPPAMNQAYRGPPQPQQRESMAYPTRYDYRDRDYDERPDGSYQTYAADYYPTGYRPYEQRPASQADYSYRSRSIDAPMAHRYPVEPPIDYSLSNSENDSSLEDITTATSATRVRFQVPRQQDIQYIDTTHQAPTPRETMSPIQKFEKIYEKFKPSKLANFMPKNKAKQKGVYSPEAVEAQHWHEETVSTDISIAKSIKEDSAFSEEVVPVQNKLAIRGDTVSIASSMTLTSLNGADNDDSGNGADQESNDGEAETNVFFFGSMRIDYMCRRVGDNVVVHYTSRNIAGPGGNTGGQIEGVFTDIEYGPGIVQKLREKFSKLATTAIETAQISPHARQKKFPSVDDILSENEQRGFSEMKQRNESHSHSHAISTSVPPAPKKAFLPPLPAAAPPPPPPPPPPQNNDLDQSETTDEESTSVAAVAPPLPEKRIDSPRSVVEESHIETISALRAKFEQQSRATTPSIRGGPTSLNLVRKSASRDDVLLYSTRSAPPPGTTEDQAESLSPPRPPKQIYTSKSDILKGSAPKPVRVLDLVSPPADPAPKGNGTETYTRGISPTSSVADSDQSPPPEEPKFKPYDDEDEEYDVDSDVSDVGEAKGYDLIEAQDKFSSQYSHDERTEERAYFQTQKSKMTLTLPIGSAEVQSKQSTTQDVRIGVPGSTPISGTGKLKVANSSSLDSNEGLSEVQRLLSKFNSMREQKVTSESETVEVNSPKQHPGHYLPTAIVPPVQSTTAQSTPPVTTASTGRFAWASPAPAVTTTSMAHSRVESDDSQWSSRHNIVSITVGEQRHDFEEVSN
uniref:Histone-lysine N-methyltransferase, H3 lysine-4 specific n=1 Tax=Panagrellus redivivus TaxID=6233 RepID=A0A7E4ZUR4_PANRE